MLSQQPDSKVVLVIDDDLMSRTKIAMAVSKLGYQSIKASGGMEGLEQLKNNRVDVVLLDLLMPEMDGFEVLEALSRSPDLSDIPVIVISSLEDEASEERATELGARRCLHKGFESSELKNCLEAILA